MTDFITLTRAKREEIESYIQSLVPGAPISLYGPVRHLLGAGGKRVRPLLTYLTSALGTTGQWKECGAAVELLHTFTLVHDDIMDNAATRRTLPTVHAKYGANAAILSGDVLIALANEALAAAQSDHTRLLQSEFAKGFRYVCEGQALDKDFETADAVAIEEYIDMIDLKTAKVMEMSAVMGAISGGALEHIESVRRFAHHIGIAFQILDDLLDLTAVEADFGKTIGGDILEGKRTYLLVTAMEQRSTMSAADVALLDRILSRSALPNDIGSARHLFTNTGVIDRARTRIHEETNIAYSALARLPEAQARIQLQKFAEMLLARSN